MRAPKYRYWKTREQGFAELHGKRQYFPGQYNSPESLAAYQEWLDLNGLIGSSPTVSRLSQAYLTHCKHFYGNHRTSTTGNIKLSVDALCELCGQVPGDQIKPQHIKQLQQHLIKRGLARSTINSRCMWVRSFCKWCVSEGHFGAEVLVGVQAVQALKRGRSQAREPARRQAVAWCDVEAALPFMSKVLQGMVQLQWHTGARSSSVCLAQTHQFCRDAQYPQLLLWRPRHKTEYLEHELIIPVGPKCQALVGKWLEREPWCFSPKESCTRGKPGEHYTKDSYRRAVQRAQEKALAAGVALQRWCPHQMRHARAQAVREAHGLEAAQAVLGHSSIQATQLYAQKRLTLACQVALREG